MSMNFTAYRLAQSMGRVLLIGPNGVQVRRLDTGAVVSSKAGGAGEYGCCAMGEAGNNTVAYLGQIVAPGNPARAGVTFASAARIDAPFATVLLPSMPRALVASEGGAWAAYNDGTRGRLRRYTSYGDEGMTVDLGATVVDAVAVPGGVAVLLADGRANVLGGAGGIIERYNFGAPVGHAGRIAGSVTHLAASGFADGVRVTRRGPSIPTSARIGVSAQSVAIVADVVLAGCPGSQAQGQPPRLERYDIATGKALAPLTTATFARDIRPLVGDAYLLADEFQGYTQHGTAPAPQPEPAPNPNPTPQPVDKGLVGTLQVTLGPAQPDGRRAVVSATGSFNPVA